MNQTNRIESQQTAMNTTKLWTSAIQSAEEEPDLQELYENNNCSKALDPEDFSLDRGWWYRCRECDGETRISGRSPRCSHCGFAQKNK